MLSVTLRRLSGHRIDVNPFVNCSSEVCLRSSQPNDDHQSSRSRSHQSSRPRSLATEGLYAEVLRIPGLVEELQRERVVPVGPTNLHALLNSLQMGFRTLAIEKRSSEVWKVLAGVKTEFAKFGTSLEAVSKKLQEASNKIDDTARRSRVLEKSLRSVETLPADSLPALEEPESLDVPVSMVVPED